MKRFLLILAIFVMFAPCAFSAPNYNPNGQPIFYDVSYNVNLRNKLENDFDKKYIVKRTENGTIYSYPTGAYYNEVIVPYDLQKKDSLAEELKRRNKN